MKKRGRTKQVEERVTLITQMKMMKMKMMMTMMMKIAMMMMCRVRGMFLMPTIRCNSSLLVTI
jgi:hypothetical protein